jgi:hypothetical protein
MAKDIPRIIPFPWGDRIIAVNVIEKVEEDYRVEIPGVVGFYTIAISKVAEIENERFRKNNQQVGLV